MPTAVHRDEVRRLVEHEAAQLVEVLPREEYEWAHLAGAVNMPLKQLDRHTAAALDRTRPVIVYCNDFQ
jgi:rhodanese-related sulfurtransferase